MQVKRITFKIKPMRKEQDWLVYPPSYLTNKDKLFIQCDKRALDLNIKTGKGMLSNGKGHPGFASTGAFLGGIEVDVPQEIIDLCISAIPKSGDKIGSESSPVSIF